MATIQPNGPGKTAPKLLADFLQFDPQKNVGGNLNILTSHPPPVGEGQVPTPHRDACKHEYTVKVNQSVTPPLDSRPDASTQYKLAVVCKRCRLHTDIRISYQQATDPCPMSESQLHHFQRAVGLDDTGAAHITYGWQCSSATCQALLTTTFKMGKFSNADRNLLTDTSKLKSRFEAVMQQDPTREGIRQATPVEALTRLRKYIRDALNTEHDKRVFPANNKRFMEAYGVHGQDCRDLLERLGFEFDEQELNWTLPNPPPIQDRLNSTGDSLREQLEDVELELLALAWRTASEMNVVNPAAGEGWSLAHRDLERILGAQGYQRISSLRRTNVANELEQYFASLGALSDFSDSLVDFAFERQTKCDVLSEPYYYECIQSIAKQRGSEELQLKTTLLESKGLVSRRDLSEAYRFFNLSSDSRSVDDDRIFNLFQAQHADSGVHGQERAREMLGRIGRARGSKMLTNASQQTIETVEEAYGWIGNNLGPEADDSFVVTMFSVRTDGNKELEEIGRKAVSIIAQARNSSFLKSWLEGDDPDQTTMNIDEALPLLGVGMPLNEMDATVWPDIFSSARSDKPGVQTERAIAAVQKALAGPSTGVNATHAPETWPVGLVSHGNTCYLNSLLQYYFSLKPLRDIVTDYDQYKMDISKSQEKLERVGQRRVSTQEILGGKKFADELRHLFGRMIKDRGTAVKPEQDLVCRAFLDPRDFAELEAQKSGNDNAIDDTTMPDLTSNGNVAEPEELDTPQSNASSQTLQADDHSADGQTGDVQMNDTDLPPSAQNAAPPSPPNSQPPSPSQKPVDQQADGSAPPPLPPRRFSTTTSDTLRQAQAKATQQQDVTEVHDSITQRLRAGMKPQGADNRGEQVDALRDLFAIGMSQTAISGTTISKPELISDSSIQLNVPTEPSDLYSALDDYFDLQVVTEGSEKQQYRSILELPPLVQINMPRIGFNKETREAYKSDAPLRLEDELYLDRYCEDAASSVLERRRSAWGWRKNLLELKKEQKALQGTGVGVEGPAAVSETARFIKSLKDVNEELIAAGEDPIEGDLDVHVALEEDAVFQAQRLESLDSQVSTLQGKLTGTFDDLKEKKYRLYAVFFHRGGSSSGHYWVSIHDFQNDIWRSYNDESVTEVQPRELDNIFYANQWQHGTPTFAVYVRDDLKDKYVQAVCRAPEDAPPATDFSGDVTMTDNSQWGDNNADNVNPQALVTEGGNGSSWDPERDVPEAKCLIPDLCDSSDSDPNREESSSGSGTSEISTESPSSGSLDSFRPSPAVMEHHLMLQTAAYRAFEAQHAVAAAAAAATAAAPAVVRDSTRPSLADTSLPYRDAKPVVEVSVTAIDPDDSSSNDGDNDDDDDVDDPPIVDISTLRRPSRSPDRKRVVSSTGAQSPPKRHARYFSDGLPDLTRWPPPSGSGGDGKGEGK